MGHRKVAVLRDGGLRHASAQSATVRQTEQVEGATGHAGRSDLVISLS